MPKLLLKNHPVRDFLFMTVGIILAAIALNGFLIPNRIAAGGFSGLATVVYYLGQQAGISIPVGMQTILANAILMIFVWRHGGVRYLAKTVYGIVGFAVAIDLFAPIIPNLAPHDMMLASLAGGVLAGVGLGLVFRVGGNTGGTDALAQILVPRTSLGLGQLMLIIDAVIIAFAGIVFGIQEGVVFGAEQALYAAISIAVTTWVIDLVIEGLSVEKAVWIISKDPGAMEHLITQDLGRGCTKIPATGVWTGMDRPILFVVLTRKELGPLKESIADIDPEALVVISDVNEAIGEGFKEIGVE